MLQGQQRTAGGFSLVEALCAASVLVVAVLGVTRSVAGSAVLTRTNRDIVLATQGARKVVEAVQHEDLVRAFQLWNADPTDDPDGPATGPGPAFDVPGLEPVDGDADGRVGRVILPARESAPDQISEADDAAIPGMPRDLDLDGNAMEADVTADARLLPVVVRVEWKTTSGPQSLELTTIVVRP